MISFRLYRLYCKASFEIPANGFEDITTLMLVVPAMHSASKSFTTVTWMSLNPFYQPLWFAGEKVQVFLHFCYCNRLSFKLCHGRSDSLSLRMYLPSFQSTLMHLLETAMAPARCTEFYGSTLSQLLETFSLPLSGVRSICADTGFTMSFRFSWLEGTKFT